MTLLTVLGQVVRPDGLTHHADALGRVDEVVFTPAAAYQPRQPADLAVHFDHDLSWRLGSVGWLGRSDRLGLMAAAVLDADVAGLLADGRWYWSDGIACRRLDTLRRGAIRLRELSLVRATGNCGTRPVVFRPSNAGEPPMPLHWREVWQRAAEAMEAQRYRRAPDHLVIVDLDEQRTDPVAARMALASLPTPAPAKTRAAVPARPVAGSRSDAAREAAALGVAGYSYVAADGRRRYVRMTGGLARLA